MPWVILSLKKLVEVAQNDLFLGVKTGLLHFYFKKKSEKSKSWLVLKSGFHGRNSMEYFWIFVECGMT
jgi:hypothetical protein